MLYQGRPSSSKECFKTFVRSPRHKEEKEAKNGRITRANSLLEEAIEGRARIRRYRESGSKDVQVERSRKANEDQSSDDSSSARPPATSAGVRDISSTFAISVACSNRVHRGQCIKSIIIME